MDSNIEKKESSPVGNKRENTSLIGPIVWVVLTIFYTVVITVSFLSEEWVIHNYNGGFGLWSSCYFGRSKEIYKIGVHHCVGQIGDFASIMSVPFKVATVLVGLSVILGILTVLALFSFFFYNSRSVYTFCGTTQTISGTFLFLGVLVFPLGWDSPTVRQICGPKVSWYDTGDCELHWTYMVAIIGFINAYIFGNLALTLTTERIEIEQEEALEDIDDETLMKFFQEKKEKMMDAK